MLFIQSEVFAPTVECSLSAATLDHRDSFMSVMKFLKTLLACPYNKEVSFIEYVYMLNGVEHRFIVDWRL